MNIIKLEEIKKQYGEGDNIVTIFENLSLEIKKGSMTAIMGPSGSGKTSLLNIIGMLDNNYSGRYFLEGNEIANVNDKQVAKIRNSKLGFVFQDFNLMKELTAKENVKLNLVFSNIHKKDKYSKKIMDKMADDVLERMGLGNHKDKRPGQLSGGQKQRVAIARAIVNNPEIILADEPTGALDSKTSQEILNCLKELNEQGKTIIIITHDKNVANQCDTQIEMVDGMLNVK